MTNEGGCSRAEMIAQTGMIALLRDGHNRFVIL